MYALFIWIAEYRFSKEITVLFLGRYDTICSSFFYCKIYFLNERYDEKAIKAMYQPPEFKFYFNLNVRVKVNEKIVRKKMKQTHKQTKS